MLLLPRMACCGAARPATLNSAPPHELGAGPGPELQEGIGNVSAARQPAEQRETGARGQAALTAPLASRVTPTVPHPCNLAIEPAPGASSLDYAVRILTCNVLLRPQAVSK